MRYRPLEGRPWVFKIPRDRIWAWMEIKLLSNSIEIQTYFSQEGNCHAMWDTTGKTNITTEKLSKSGSGAIKNGGVPN